MPMFAVCYLVFVTGSLQCEPGSMTEDQAQAAANIENYDKPYTSDSLTSDRMPWRIGWPFPWVAK